jgi:cellulose synthase/poly-beta-1,6-N-acetylglucosamine synthase-like glycosyltransferase
MTVAGVVFWAGLALVLYAYAGYPLLLWLAARLAPRPAVRKDALHQPTATVLIVAHDEERHIAAKLEDCLALDYPRDRLEVVVVSDGSTDATDEIVRSYADRGVRLLRVDPPAGKPTGINRALGELTGEVVILCDARQRLDPGAARALAANFADPTVGAVSGELFILGAPGSAAASGVGAYWRYEKVIRREEARLDSVVGVTGAIYAIRRALLRPLDPRTVLDDVAVPMEVVRAGQRVVFEPDARAFDEAAPSAGAEYRRKARTLAGNLQLVALHPWLLDPRQNRLWWPFVSHKLVRLAVPWALLAVLAANGALAASGASPLYRAALAAQLLAYGAAGLGWMVEGMGGRSRLLAVPYAFVMLNLAAAAAPWTFMRRGGRPDWKQRASAT